MFRQQSIVIVILAISTWGPAPWMASAKPPEPVDQVEPDVENQIDRLMTQLGDEKFSARERATEQLIRIGSPAATALENGSRQADREVRYRAERILAIVREADFHRRLDAFLMDSDPSNGHALPGWDRYRECIGNDATARELFVAMQRDEPDVMQALEQDAQHATQIVLTRCHELTMAMRHPTERHEPTLGAIAALVFATGREDVSVDQTTAAYLYQLCEQNAFANAVRSGRQSQFLRRLLAGWIRRAEEWTAYQGIMLAMRYDLKEGVEPAIRTLLEPDAAPLHVRLYAMLTIAKLGGEEQIEILERQLDDQTVYGGNHTINNVAYQTQMCDVALAALWRLVDENPKKHGFDHIQPHPHYVFNSSTAGFANDQTREKAQAKWREFREAMKKRS